ncbi:hypothetical protein BVRB_036220 [Beta vulgaris subsp. vulgaris]|uniref:Oxidoreductase-like domain-containing protein n=1 Tax=Beta vulgaris subsp. vulgaris TaxID=3555 RepID=A0A0J8BI83_BETVV|nr:hypothetical protein BVRB_036220 [Beta vulgaris subsp. vulgaris]
MSRSLRRFWRRPRWSTMATLAGVDDRKKKQLHDELDQVKPRQLREEDVGPCGREPMPPDPESCCGNNCPNCVWTVYWDELQEYQRRCGV